MLKQITEQMQLELRPGLDGYGVDSIVKTNWGGTARNQVFWSKDEAAALAFMQGVQMMAALQQ